jgi:WD40 repeat protein
VLTICSSVHIAPAVASGSRARLYCSNNDQSISIWDVYGPNADASSRPQLLRADILPLNTAVNATALSPDRRLAVAVGDSTDVFLYDVSVSGKHKLVKTMTASRDSGFSVAWSRSGNSFAVASQDGGASSGCAQRLGSSLAVLSVFDVRQCLDSKSLFATPSTGKLASILTSNAGPYTGAARVVKYSPGSDPGAFGCFVAFSAILTVAHRAARFHRGASG